MTGPQIWDILQGLTAQVGLDSQTFYDQMNNSTTTWQVTREWKWSSSRGIFSTPSYFGTLYFLFYNFARIIDVFACSKWGFVVECTVGFRDMDWPN